MSLFRTLLLLFTIVITNFSYAQEDDRVQRCGTEEYMQQLIAEDPEMEQAYHNYLSSVERLSRGEIGKKTSANVFQIPVVFHVIYNSEYDNISKAQVLDGLRVLNEDFRRQNSDANNTRPAFIPDAADIEIEFVLATKDPNGNCTDGITRRSDVRSLGATNNVKTIVRWPTDRYLNIWVVNSISSSISSNVLGYAQFPGQNPNTDGVVIRHDALGTIGTAANAGRLGRTLPHEVGHSFGLPHPFGSSPYGCNKDDGIGDTPKLDGPSYGCNTNKSTCGSLDQIENFMDYADDQCTNMFTTGQKSVMRNVSNTFRSFLKSSSNLNLAGVLNPLTCTPTADISIESPAICPGGQVEFEELSNSSAATSWQWSFPGGQPATSNLPNPVVVYPNAGEYDVTLVVTNSAGTDTRTFSKFVRVRPFYTGNEASYFESFEGTLEGTGAMINSPEDISEFQITSQAAVDGNNSLYLDNFTAGAYAPMTTVKGGGATDEFITPVIFPTFAKNLTMTFEFAFAARQSSNNYDAMRVYASEDCGVSWNLIRIFQSGQLRTAPDINNSPFVPSAGQWRTAFIPLGGFEGKGSLLVKIQFENGGGNNFYIDDIQVTSDNVSITEYDLAKNISVFPNPSNGVVNVRFNQETQYELKVELYDLAGKTVISDKLPAGTTDYKIGSGEKLPSGIYLLQVEEDGMRYAERIVVK
jgi:PKD repeat protein